jgi:hypothetical protein
VAMSRDSGPLTVDQTSGSVAGGVYTSSTENQSAGVSQHWALLANDDSGQIVLGVMVSDSGIEAVSGWVPGTSQVSNWVFNISNASPAGTYQVTVPGTSFTVAEPSTGTANEASPSELGQISSRAISEHVKGTCTGIIATPYTYSSKIYYSGTVLCNIPAVISDLLTLWDFYNNTTNEEIKSTLSGGVEVDYPEGTATCNVGYAPRNYFSDQMATTITWPPVSVPPTALDFTVSPPAPLPCNQ